MMRARKKLSHLGMEATYILLALAAGCLVNYVGDRLIGIRIELFYGLDTFGFWWFVQLFILPLLAGLTVSLLYGFGGKWIAHFPPLIVRFIAYLETQHITGIPDGTSLMPMAWWGFFVILAIECSFIGGIMGEILIKKTYGRHQRPPASPVVTPPPPAQASRDSK